jgi:hypothetical protein
VDDDKARKFEERLRNLIYERTDGGETTTHVSRIQVEKIGEELDISPRQACAQFFALKTFVWDVQDAGYSMIHSNESGGLPPPRNWLGINDVYLAD